MHQKIEVLGIGVSPISVDELHQHIASYITADSRAMILHVNAHGMNLAYERPWLVDLLNSAEVVFCDGAGVMLAARILGKYIPERITYADWFWQFGHFAEEEGFSIFFLGGKPGVADDAAVAMKKRFPNLQIAGTQHGYFDKSANSVENDQILKKIKVVKPDVLVIGFGMPLQERWLLDNLEELDANVILTGGAVFDYISGNLQRAPKWMTDNGFEWLGRLFIEPKRLWRRYIIGNPLFFWRVLKYKLGIGSS